MPNKMERFTPRAQHVLMLTQAEAERMSHDVIDTEHLLLGMLREDGGVAGRVLRDLGMEQRRVEELVEELSRATAFTPISTLDLSPGMKRVLELAVDEARRMEHHYIGTEHMLLGLMRQSEGVAIEILKRLGVSPEEVRRQTRRVLQQEAPQAAQSHSIFQLEFIERFTQRARFALDLAIDKAEQMQHSQIDTGHLLIGLMREENGAAGRALRDLDLEQGKLNDLVAELTQAIPRTSNQPLELSPDLKLVLELAVDEARRIAPALHQKAWDIGTESLLLALVRHEDGVAVQVLKRLGVSPEEVRRQTRRVLQEPPVQTQSKPKIEVPEQPPARIRMTKNRMLRVTVIDTDTGATKFEVKLAPQQVQRILDVVYVVLEREDAAGIVLDDKDRSQRIEIFIEDDEPPTAEAGAENVS